MAGFLAEALRRISRPVRSAVGGAASFGQQFADPTARKVLFGQTDPNTLSSKELNRLSKLSEAGFKATLTDKEEQQVLHEQSPGEVAFRQTAGLASLAVPGGKTIGSAIGLGALSGGLGSIQEKEDLTKGVIGGGIGGGLAFGATKVIEKGLPKLQKTFSGKKIEAKGKEFQLNSLKRSVGMKPNAKEGGVKLLDDVMELSKGRDMTVSSADDAIKLSADVFDDWGSVVRDELSTLTDKGVDTDGFMTSVTQVLKDKMGKASVKDEQIIGDIATEIAENIEKFGDTPLGWYKVKQLVGDKGKWNINFQPQLKPQKEAYNAVYTALNGEMEGLLGETFREANKNVSTAINLQSWARRSENATLPSALKFIDPTMDIGIAGGIISAISGSPTAGVAGIGGMALKQTLETPRGGQLVGQGMEKLGQKIGEKTIGFGGIPGIGLNQLQKTGAQVAGRQLGQTTMGGAGQPSQDDISQSQLEMVKGLFNQGYSEDQVNQTLKAEGFSDSEITSLQNQFVSSGMSKTVGESATGGIPGIGQQQAPQMSIQDVYLKKMQLEYISSQYPEIRGQVQIAQQMLDMQLEQSMSGGETGAKLTEKQHAVSSAIGGLEEVQQSLSGGISTGPIAAFGGKISRITGSPTDTEQLKIDLENTNMLIRNAFLGSGMSETELKSLDLPKVSDQEAVIAYKIESLKRRLEGLL